MTAPARSSRPWSGANSFAAFGCGEPFTIALGDGTWIAFADGMMLIMFGGINSADCPMNGACDQTYILAAQ